MALKKVNTTAPAFSLPDKTGESLALSSLLGNATVIYFYPRDNTPGCTIEAQEFNSELKKFKNLGVSVIGISGGDEKSKSKFCKEHGLKFTLLSDSDYKVSKKYGVYGKKSFMGRTFNGIKRTTFVLDGKGKIRKIFENVKPAGHSKEVLQCVNGLLSSLK